MESGRNPHQLLFIVVLIVVVLLLWKWYWKVQVMYNSSIVGLYTPDTFSIPPQYRDQYNKMTDYGFRQMERKTVVICALLRDVAPKMKTIRERAERLGKVFLDYRIVIVENDSNDNTRELLNKWRETNSKVHILGCKVNSKERCRIPQAAIKTEGHSVYRQRIEKMVHLRNIYLEYVKSVFPRSDYTIVWDMDIIGTVYLDGVANSVGYFSYPASPIKSADAICAYGLYRWAWMTLYYDTYAHIDKHDRFHIDLKTVHDIKKGVGVKYDRGTPPIHVISCFSGFTIYKTSSLTREGVVYDMSPPDNLECEHVRLHRKLNKVYLNPSMIHLVLLND